MSRIHVEGGVSVRVGYETLPKDLSSAEVARFFHPDGKVRDVIRSVRERGAQVALAVQAGAVRAIGRLLDHVDHVPLLVTQYVCEELGLRPTAPAFSRRRITRWKHERWLCEALGVRRFTAADRELVRAEVERGALEALGEDDLLALAEGFLRRGRVLLPPVRNLRRLVRECRGLALEGALQRAGETLDKNAKLRLHRLLEADPKGGPCDLLWISQPPGDPRADNLEDLVARKKRLEELGLDFRSPLDVSDAVRSYLVQRAQAYSPQALQQLPKETRYGLLVFRLREQHRKILDWITFMHGTILHGVRRKAKNAVLKKAGTLTTNLPQLMTLLGDLCEIVLEHARTPALIGPEILRHFGLDVFEDALDRARSFTARGAETSWDYLLRRHGTVKAATDLFLEGVSLVSTHGEDPVLGAVEYYQEHVGRRRSELPPDAPLDFVPPAWRERVVSDEGVIERKAWQLCLAEQVTEKIRSGQLVVPGSASFEELGKYVMPAEIWKGEGDRLMAGLAVDRDPDRQLAKMGRELEEQARGAARALFGKDGVRLERGKIIVTPLEEEPVPPRDQEACRAVREGLRTRRIEELLLAVDDVTKFLDSFTHLGSGRAIPRQDWEARTALLSAILAKGFNHGLSTLARSIEGMTRRKIETAAEQYLRQETIQAATAKLVDFQLGIPISKAWGEGRTASHDGQKHYVSGESLYAGYNPRYFPGYKRGVVALSSVADVQMPFYTQVVPVSVREAGYVLDGLLGHGSGLRLEEQYLDTHGFTELAGALGHVLGFRLAPRIANLKDQRLWLLGNMKRSDFGSLGQVFAGRIDPKFIKEHWEEMLRMAATIREGRVKPSVLLRKIASLPRSNHLFRAWQDLGRLVKTIYLLDYVSDPALRRRVLVGLNKGEERNALAKRFFHGTDGGFRTGDHLAQLHAVSCLNLLISTVAVANTMEYQRVWEEKGGAASIPIKALRHLSPLSSEGVIYLGKYWFPKETEGPSFRPARETA